MGWFEAGGPDGHQVLSICARVSSLDNSLLLLGHFPICLAIHFCSVMWWESTQGFMSMRRWVSLSVMGYLQKVSTPARWSLCWSWIHGWEYQSFGISIEAVNDLQKEMGLFQIRQGQKSVVVGDVGDPAIVATLHSACQSPALVSGGFSCQPWSALGDKRKSGDPRSGSLVQVA